MFRWNSILLLCLLALGNAVCQDMAEPAAALDPAAAAELLPEYAASTPQEAAALVPLSEDAKAQLVQTITSSIQTSKDEVKQALANPNAAFEQYTAQWASGAISVASVAAPGSAGDTRSTAQRKRIFLANLRKYDRLNAASTTVAHGITPFTHLTQAEFKAIMLPHDYSTQFQAADFIANEAGSLGRKLKACGDPVANPYATGTPPTGVNWVTASMLTPIRDQGACGSCAAFATTAVAEFCYIKKNKIAATKLTTVDLSEQELLDCTTGNQCNGATLDQYFRKITCAGGMANETAAVYKAVDKDVCSNPKRGAVGMTGWAYTAAKSVNSLALAVAKAPTLTAVDATTWSSYAGGYLPCTAGAGTTINHAVVAAGYVNAATINGVKQDYWIVRNSWSTYWGSANTAPYKGYVMVRKDCTGSGAFNMYLYSSIVPIAG